MPNPKTAIIGTFLLLGNFAVTLQARPGPVVGSSVRKADTTATDMVSSFLQRQGLVKEAAEEKARYAFGDDAAYASVWMHNLHAHCAGLSMEKLEQTVARRALFGQRVDLSSYDALVGLVHEVLGKTPDADELRRLRHVAAANGSLKGLRG